MFAPVHSCSRNNNNDSKYHDLHSCSVEALVQLVLGLDRKVHRNVNGGIGAGYQVSCMYMSITTEYQLREAPRVRQAQKRERERAVPLDLGIAEHWKIGLSQQPCRTLCHAGHLGCKFDDHLECEAMAMGCLVTHRS